VPRLPFLDVAISFYRKEELHWGYHLGFGLDTSGFYIDGNTGLSVGGSVQVDVGGSVELLGGLVSGDVKAGVGARMDARLGLFDPNGDGRIHLTDISRPGDNVAQALLNHFRVSVFGEVFAHAEVDVSAMFGAVSWTVWSHDWPLRSLHGAGECIYRGAGTWYPTRFGGYRGVIHRGGSSCSPDDLDTYAWVDQNTVVFYLRPFQSVSIYVGFSGVNRSALQIWDLTNSHILAGFNRWHGGGGWCPYTNKAGKVQVLAIEAFHKTLILGPRALSNMVQESLHGS
jgi:hypothetical protein